MALSAEDGWSDSDEDVVSEVETSVLLGIPDGPMDAVSDINDAAVSRIGGHPAFLPSTEPSLTTSQCNNCSCPMELLVQMWCPFEDSPMDRALYIWGCRRGGCQKRDGSVRAWRGLRYNDKYAAKLEKKVATKKEREAKATALEAAAKATLKSNPFSMDSSSTPNPFGLGSQIFGDAPPPETASLPTEEVEDEPSDTESDPASSEESSLITAMTATKLDQSPWPSAPSYPPLYLSTSSEYLPPLPKSKLPPGVRVEDPADSDGKGAKDATWAFEAYENSLDIDQVFERFTKRVHCEGEQCVRYELNGTPLPFASDKVFDTLFPVPPVPLLPVTKSDFKVVPVSKRTYVPTSIPSCKICGSKRVFECQLMPNLINVLRASSQERESSKNMTDEERKRAVERALKGSEAADRREMEWGTCMVFSCEKDCCVEEIGKGEVRECWREEVVLVQWDD